MKLETVRNYLQTSYRKGAFIRIRWCKPNLESAAARKAGHNVTKFSEATVRLGVNYENLKAVKLLREKNGPPQPFKVWFKHDEDIPIILENLTDPSKKYLQCFPIAKGGNTKVQYYIDGCPATKQEVIDSGLCNASTFKDSGEDKLIFNLPIEHILTLGKIEQIIA